MKKLNKFQILGISAGISLVLFLALYFALISPTQARTEELNKTAKSTEDAGGTAQQVSAKQTEKKKETDKAKKASDDWRVYSSRYMPDLAFDPKGNLIEIYQEKGGVSGTAAFGVKDIPTVWGRWVESWYDAQKTMGVVRDNPVFALDAYPTDPNNISKLVSLTFPASKPWSVSVTAKSFSEAMAHLRRFNGMTKHGMPVISNVAITGHSPNLKLTYDLTLYVIPGKEPPKEDPRIAGGTGTGGGGGGMMGGMSGGGGGSQSAMMSMMMGGSRGSSPPAATSGGGGGKGAASAD